MCKKRYVPVPRLSNQQYLERHHGLRQFWLHDQSKFGCLTVSQQWDLHAYFVPSKDVTDEELLEHRQVTTKEQPSLPHQAGKAFAALTGRGPQTYAPDVSGPGPHRLHVSAVANPELDTDALARALLQLVRERQRPEQDTA